MEKDIKKTRLQKPETKEKISNSQRVRFARYKRALKENELRKLEPVIIKDTVPLDDFDLYLELKFQLADEIELMIDAMFQLFSHQLKMEKQEKSKQKVNEIMNNVDVASIVDRTIKDYFEENILNDEDNRHK